MLYVFSFLRIFYICNIFAHILPILWIVVVYICFLCRCDSFRKFTCKVVFSHWLVWWCVIYRSTNEKLWLEAGYLTASFISSSLLTLKKTLCAETSVCLLLKTAKPIMCSRFSLIMPSLLLLALLLPCRHLLSGEGAMLWITWIITYTSGTKYEVLSSKYLGYYGDDNPFLF